MKLPIAAGAIGEFLSYQASNQLQWLSPVGSGTVNSGVSGRVAYYPATNTAVNDTSALTTDGSTWVRIADGSAAVAGLGFNTSVGTGLYLSASNTLGITVGTVPIATIDNEGLDISRDFTGGLAINISNNSDTDGAASSISVNGESGTGAGAFVMRKNPPATTGNYTCGIAKSNSVDFSSSSQTILNVMVDMQYVTNGVYFGSTTSNRHWNFSQSGELIYTNTTVLFKVTNAGRAIVFAGTEASPGLAIAGDENTGIWGSAANAMAFVTDGTNRMGISTTTIRPGLIMQGVDGLVSAPAYSFVGETSSGIYRNSASVIRCASLGVDAISWDNSSTAGGTRLNVFDNDNGQLERVSVGAADSGGAGFKVLRIPN